jgi:hypothetical protein
MDNWEYMVIDLPHVPAKNESNLLNIYGNEGWELVCVTEAAFGDVSDIDHKAYFKRKINTNNIRKLP